MAFIKGTGELKGLYLALLVIFIGLLLSWAPYGFDVEERFGLTWLFWARGPKEAPSEIVIVAVDRRSAKKSGWPEKPDQWPRTLHAELVRGLSKACAQVIVYDMFFGAPRSSGEDRVFADAIRDAGNVILVGHLGIMEDELLLSLPQANIQMTYFPVPVLAEAAAGVAPFPLPNAPVGVTGLWVFKTNAGDIATLPTLAFQLYALDAYEDFLRVLTKLRPDVDEATQIRDDLLASVIYRDLENDDLSSLDGSVDNGFSTTGAFSLEAQYRHGGERLDVIMGAGHMDQDRSDTSIFIDEFGTSSSAMGIDGQHTNAYLYSNLHLAEILTATLGVTYDAFDSLAGDQRHDVNRVNPKLGLWWQPSPSTVLRAAWFTTVKRPFVSNQTIESTQIAGFNQFLDDTNGSKTARWGVGLDQSFTNRLYGGLEASWRDVERPTSTTVGFVFEKRREQLHRAYLYAAPTDEIALSAEYVFEDFDRDVPNPRSPSAFTRLTNQRVPLAFNYYHPMGIVASFKATYFNQDVEHAQRNDIQGTEQFWVLDTTLGYRLPERNGIVTFGVKNLLDKEFRFQDTRFASNEPIPALFLPDRTLFAQFTLAY